MKQSVLFISKRCSPLGFALVCVICLAMPAEAQSVSAPRYSKVILSDVYTVDQKYRSMKGPSSTQAIQLGEQTPRELLWITGYRATMVGPDGHEPQSQEFMCHSNLDLDIKHHANLFGWDKVATQRLFTLSQGQYDISFPPGFGVPIFSDEVLSLATQVLNHNIED